jgi:hypothetical protein
MKKLAVDSYAPSAKQIPRFGMTRVCRTDRPTTNTTSNDQPLTPALKERLQHICTATRQNTTADFDVVCQLRVIQYLQN